MIARLFPPIFVRAGRARGRANARNNPLRIWINADVRPECFAAILAQERFEMGFKWRVGILPALFLRRHIELMGHAIESEVAVRWYGVDRDQYERAEAASLLTYRAFRKLDFGTCLALVRGRRSAARAWVDGHQDFINWAFDLGARLEKQGA